MTGPGEKKTVDRRELLAGGVRAVCGAGFFALGLGMLGRQAETRAAQSLRPPGALAEADFLAACSRCGLCVRDCPWDTLRLAGIGDGAALGTPFFDARAVPCEMCQDIPCVVACPTGALDHRLTDIKQAKMGVAVLVGQETCLNFLGLRCDVCYRVCPLIDEAITLERSHNERTGKHARFIPTVHSDKCTGCGKCEKACVLEEAAIKVLPAELALGRLGGHYRLGWEEKRKHGESLLKDIIDLPDRGYGDGTATPYGGAERGANGAFKEFKP
ncbi:MAG: ferredoxin-type protein NapG [Alphaproteobacteria bacterium]|nr:ferredoxin-type protein NapG [Alphaproteobacteria bacterium]